MCFVGERDLFLFDLMGILVGSQERGGGGGGNGRQGSWVVLKSLIRRKKVDSVRSKSKDHQLAKELSILHLIAIGNLF